MKKTVYVRAADDVHEELFQARIAIACQYGDVVVGLLTDRVLTQSARPARLNFERRRNIVCSLAGVTRVVAQDDFDGIATLRSLQPDYYICGLEEDLISNPGRALGLSGEWGGQLIAFDRDQAGSEPLQLFDLEFATTSSMRVRQLRRLLTYSGLVRAIEVHSPLCGLIVENAAVERDGRKIGFDAMWSSSLVDSTIRGKPDIEVVEHSARLAMLNELFEVTTKPVIYDADTGGMSEHFAYTVRSLERLGVSAVVIEDKIGVKRNSLLGPGSHQGRESIDNFCRKIGVGKAAQSTKDFAIIGRVESFILDAGLEDALQRSHAYVEAGADGIMIHSRRTEPDEVFAFCERFRTADTATALVVVPTSYGGVYERELENRGVNVVIYANHLMRASYPAMVKVARSILEHGRCREADQICMSIDEVLRLIPGTADR